MSKFKTLTALSAGCLIGALLVTSLPAGAVGGKDAAQIAALKRRVTALESRADDIESLVYGCFLAQGMSSYGTDTEGYLYQADGTQFITTALDYDGSVEPQIWSIISDPTCVDTSGLEGRRLPSAVTSRSRSSMAHRVVPRQLNH